MLRRHCSLASTLSRVTPSMRRSSSVENPEKLAGGIGGGTGGNIIINNKQFHVFN